MLDFITLHTYDTEYSADSIEWCPHSEYLSYFACGTYQLEESNNASNSLPASGRRKGRVLLFYFEASGNKLIELQRLETAAILDMKWLNQANLEMPPTLITVDAIGQVNLYELKNDALLICHSLNVDAKSTDCLVLSIDWRYLNNSSNVFEILVSDSKGGISMMSYTVGIGLKLVHTVKAHDFEAWICVFDKYDYNRFYTGGDDTLLHAYDLRSNSRILTNKSHTAGVTCLLSHVEHEYLLATGSYDEQVRLFDTRSMKQPREQINLNGGIWRIKPDPAKQNLLLVACMYNNFSIIQIQGDTLELLGVYNEHKSICYGADWCCNIQNGRQHLYTATCSFYDHKLCLACVRER